MYIELDAVHYTVQIYLRLDNSQIDRNIYMYVGLNIFFVI